MDIGKTLEPRHFLVEPGVVFHRAAAERKQANVDRIILAAETGIVTHHLALGQAGNGNRRFAFETAETAFDLRCIRQIDTAAVRRSDFKNQRFVNHQSAISCVGRDAILFRHNQIGFLFRRTSFGEHAHDRAPSSAAANCSISPLVEVSVTATSNPCASGVTSG